MVIVCAHHNPNLTLGQVNHKKKPLRPRGRTDEKRQSAKDAIRDAYANGPQREVQIIPAKRDLETGQPQKKLRVCAY